MRTDGQTNKCIRLQFLKPHVFETGRASTSRVFRGKYNAEGSTIQNKTDLSVGNTFSMR